MPDLVDSADQERAPIGTAELRPLAVIIGTEGPDAGATALIGTPEDDEIRGRGGDDEVFGRGGNDELHGGPGNDEVRGEFGNDVIFGGPGADELHGGFGSDEVRGSDGADTILGGPGDDELHGGPGNDLIRGNEDNDLIFGGGGDDELHGGPGNDEIRGQDGNDTVIGGPGDDELHGGPGNDLVRGNDGNDVILGGPGDDELHGGPGNDVIEGGSGSDELNGGGGVDTFRFTIVEPPIIDTVVDFNEAEDRFDLRPVLPDFETGDDLGLFVQFAPEGDDARLSVDPGGTGTFQDLALLLGVTIDSLPASQLGLTGDGTVTERTIASTNAAGTPGNGVSFAPSLSQDGTLITFSSSATNFIADDTAVFDVFIKNLQTESIARVSETAEGTGNADSFFSAISANGNEVAFDSLADNFPSNLNPGNTDVFVADRGADTLEFVSIQNNQFATLPSISADGTLVAFQATATGGAETGAPEGDIIPRIFVRDLSDDSLQEVSTSAEDEFADALSRFSDISADGSFVAFDSEATNLHPDDTNPASDVFRKNLDDGTVDLVSVTPEGAQDVGRGANAPSISGDGRFVAFQTTARLVDDDPEEDNINDIYVKDLNTDAITLVSTSAAGVKGNAESLSPSISDDGTLVAFRSAADNLVDGDTNGVHDIFVKNLTTNEILRFEVDGDTSGIDLAQAVSLLRPSLSGDGSTVAFSDQVTVEEGEITASQVAVAPVDFGAGIAAADAGTSLQSLLAPDDVAAV